MKSKKIESAKPGNLAELAAALRALPKPPVPVGLEQRLIDGTGPVQPVRKRIRPALMRWAAVGAGIAAAVIFAILLSNDTRSSHQKRQPSGASAMSNEDIRRAVQREAISARLLAAATILDKFQAGKADAAETRKYVLESYGDTSAAKRLTTSDSEGQGDI